MEHLKRSKWEESANWVLRGRTIDESLDFLGNVGKDS